MSEERRCPFCTRWSWICWSDPCDKKVQLEKWAAWARLTVVTVGLILLLLYS